MPFPEKGDLVNVGHRGLEHSLIIEAGQPSRAALSSEVVNRGA